MDDVHNLEHEFMRFNNFSDVAGYVKCIRLFYVAWLMPLASQYLLLVLYNVQA